MPKFIMNMIEKYRPNYGKEIKTGYPDFDENFKLYCNSEDVVESIISDRLIVKIIEIRDKLKKLSKENKPTNSKRYNQYVEKYMNQDGIIKISLFQNNVCIALQNMQLFEINFGKKATENIGKLSNSLEYIKMTLAINHSKCHFSLYILF